jgi:hypothetical protein
VRAPASAPPAAKPTPTPSAENYRPPPGGAAKQPATPVARPSRSPLPEALSQ